MKKLMAVFAMIAVVAMAAPAMAATNPFMDVPQGHWAYDAVALLASRGIVSGYPDGAFKGAQPATRYELASVVARALVTIDAEKASKQDLELLKKLVMEFKDELDALGVKVDKIDKRVAVIEKRLGGWSLRGQIYFDAKFTGDSDKNFYGLGADSDKKFGFGRARIWLEKQIDDNTFFQARLNMPNGTLAWDRYFVKTKLPYDVDFTFGRFNFDWEGDAGLYNPDDINNDATFGDINITGFQFMKKWDKFSFTGIVGRDSEFDYSNIDAGSQGTWGDENTHMTYAARLNADFTDKFMMGLWGYWWKGDNKEVTMPIAGNSDVNTYGVYAGYKFTPSVELKGLYYWQKIDLAGVDSFNGDDPKSWKVILDVKQDLLKFTSLWIEYAQETNTFQGTDCAYDYIGANPQKFQPFNDNTAKMWLVRADQKWNDKWGTYLRYFQGDWDTNGIDKTTEYSAGVTNQYTPAIQFKVEYDNIDYGWVNGVDKDSDHIVRFRTTVNF